MRVSRVCAACGRPFTRLLTAKEFAQGRGKFCSKECLHSTQRVDWSPAGILARMEVRSERTPEGCLVWTGYCDDEGYGAMRGLDRESDLLHRLSYKILVGPIPAGQHVLHKCDNPPCWEPAHLFLGTQRDNNDDCYAKGRYHRKLTDDQVREIRSRLTGKYGEQAALAREFGVGNAALNALAKGRTYRNVS